MILPAVLPEADLAAARELFWSLAESDTTGLRRNDPLTWLRAPVEHDEGEGDGPFLSAFGSPKPPEQHGLETRPPDAVSTRGYRLFMQPAGDRPELMKLLRTNADVLAIARQMLGEGVCGVDEPAEDDNSTRGIYVTLPQGDDEAHAEPFVGFESHGAGGAGTLEKHQRVHFDGCADERRRLGVTTYIDAVPPGGGSFLVWPRTHTRMHTDIWHTEGMERRFDKESEGPVHPQVVRVRQRIHEIVRDTQPVDCHGPAGTLVLCAPPSPSAQPRILCKQPSAQQAESVELCRAPSDAAHGRAELHHPDHPQSRHRRFQQEHHRRA